MYNGGNNDYQSVFFHPEFVQKKTGTLQKKPKFRKNDHNDFLVGGLRCDVLSCAVLSCAVNNMYIYVLFEGCDLPQWLHFYIFTFFNIFTFFFLHF